MHSFHVFLLLVSRSALLAAIAETPSLDIDQSRTRLASNLSIIQNATRVSHAPFSISSSLPSSIQQHSTRSASSSSSSSEASTSSGPHFGDYIASGLGLSKPTTTPPSTTLAQIRTSPSKNYTTSKSVATTTPILQNSATYLSHQNSSNGSHVSSILLPSANVSGNWSFDSGNCWSDWMSHWSVDSSVNAVRTVSQSATATLTSTATETWSESADPATTSTHIYTWTISNTMSAHGFTYLTATVTTTATKIVTFHFEPGTTYTTTTTFTDLPGKSQYITTPHVSVPTPTCNLPQYVPQCQSLWDAYAAVQMSTISENTAGCTGTSVNSSCSQIKTRFYSAASSLYVQQQKSAPACSQASVDSAACSHFYDEYISEWVGNNTGTDPAGGNPVQYLSLGFQYSYSTAPNGTVTSSAYWPSTSILAPGCSIGCGPCAITGGTVRLLYWPVTETGRSNSTTAQSNPSNSPATAYGFGTSFISPTVYISYKNIFASNSCGGLGSTHSTTIVPLSDPAALSSVWQTWSMITDATAPFNYTDLSPPVPQSIYDRQPQCASWSETWLLQNEYLPTQNTSQWICPRTGPYAPILGELETHWHCRTY